MVKTLVIGDLHFNDKPRGILDAQISFTKKLLEEGKRKRAERVIFLGDLMMHRKPSPSVLLGLKSIVDHAEMLFSSVVILRGNHDSETKADDGVTALFLFSSPKTRVVRHFELDTWAGHAYIPHYEDEERIKEALEGVPEGFTVFGHFGYNGALNSVGDLDFSIPFSAFTHPTILGHIHGYKQDGLVTIMGTPFSTSFQECGKECFYGILDESGLEVHHIDFGIRHLQMDYENVEENLYWLNDKNYYTILRINMSSLGSDQGGVSELLSRLDVGFYEIKYKPLIDTTDEFEVDGDKEFILEIGDDLIEEYINASKSQIGKEELLEGLSIINENQRSRD